MSTGNRKDRAGIEPPPAESDEADAEGTPSAEDLQSAPEGKRTGRVKFDDRGNAIWEWSVATGAFGRDVSADRLKKLENRALSLAEDAPTPFDRVQPNPHGMVKGYDPYDSGKLGRARAPKKTDLRKLGDWLKLKKQVASNRDDD
jgi:hypothetical protein